MNLQRPNASDATRTTNRSKDVVPMSGLCVRCLDGCTGNCEVFKATFRGRELIYPGPFGEITAGGDKDYPVDYSHLNIQGYALGAEGLPPGVIGGPDTAIFADDRRGLNGNGQDVGRDRFNESETQNSKSETNLIHQIANDKTTTCSAFRTFEFCILNLFRISIFVFRV